jgi:hypothetical protein
MPIYTLYPCSPGGTSATFDAFELASDDDAQARARQMLARHQSSTYVAIWEGERRVGLVHRDPSPVSAPAADQHVE